MIFENKGFASFILLWQDQAYRYGSKGAPRQTPEQGLQLLKDFVTEHGRVPIGRERYKDVGIGKWCSDQRDKKRQGVLSKEMQEGLEEVPGWSWEVRN